jgi:3-oxoacyl-[acyl-carrier protein] reductase
MDVNGGCALVTGASRGIGAAIARGLAQDGLRVAVNYRADRDGAEQVAREIEQAGGQALPVQADLAQPGAERRLFEEVEERLGPVVVLVNNAGTRADALSPQLDDEAWEQVLETNLSAAFRTTRRALGPMLRARHGRIVNIASVVGGARANPGQANYAASKAGLVAMTKTIAAEVARRSVTVNAVAPGFVDTELTEGVGRELLKAVPARRPGKPEEIAACVRFLVSDEASYVTGTLLTVDGGLTA